MKKLIAKICAALLFATSALPAFAGVISSSEVLHGEQISYTKQQILSSLSTEESKAKIVSLGVSYDDASTRIDSMTEEELAMFNEQLSEMPAGGDGVVIFILILMFWSLYEIT